MEKWEGLVGVVTGASSGIGKSIALKLADHGVKVAALARREERLKDIASSYVGKGKIYPFKCDISNTKEVNDTFELVEKQLGQVRLLINNAGVAPKPPFGNFELNKWREMFDTNVFGMFECIKVVVDSVRRNNPGLVHIVNINSVSGHYTPENLNTYPYSASKHCVTLLTRGLIKQIALDKLSIRVTSLSPGLVKTDIMTVQGVDNFFEGRPYLEPNQVAEALLAVLVQPNDVIISELTIKPVGEAY